MTSSKAGKKKDRLSRPLNLLPKKKFQKKPSNVKGKRLKHSSKDSTSRRKAQSSGTDNLRDHVTQYRDCELCPISDLTTQKVFFRGSSPATFLFIGEAPGDSEDSIGQPFVGPSGKLLDQMLADADFPIGSYGISNSIACTPFEDEKRLDIRAPTSEEIKNCSPRLLHLTKVVRPHVIIAIGRKAEISLTKLKLEHEAIQHPAFILRQGGSGSVAYKRNILKLRKIRKEYLDG